MTIKVLIAHAEGEEAQAELLAKPLEEAGYEPVHYGSILVGESFTEEASKILASNGPVVLCGTIKAAGTGLPYRLINAARSSSHIRIFPVLMEPQAYLGPLAQDSKIADWQNPEQAKQDLIAALNHYFPLDQDARESIQKQSLESRYRALALKSNEIIDMDILGGDDRHLAHREMEVRRLYVGLRMRLEVRAGDETDEKTLEALERRRAVVWGGGRREEAKDEGLVSLGERLHAVRRLVVLGDPGAGKSTLLRWLATACLLRTDPAWCELPDIASLPQADWLPILIRCRDLPPGTANLDDMLRHSLRKSELSEAECTELVGLLRDKLKDGAALLLIDGLDEITEPSARARFSRQLEQIHRTFEQAPMVVTSRIVGYREMGYRLRGGFEHLTVAEFTREDKDDFARRWCQLTERPERRDEAAADLIHDIHSIDRIERLTGNPMLLATMALVKRKIGVLPQRRAELYQEAVKMLLNWRSVVDAPLDTREALPQLEYLAHAMCADGIQALREDQALDLLRQMREDYPQIHPLSQHSPEDFLALLERRTGLLIQSGHIRHNGTSVPVYEFRHLTIQEYLAGLALVQGHYWGWDKEKSLAEVVAPLAGLVEIDQFGEAAVAENWREALRLCIAICNDQDVDTALQAILQPLPGETETERPRAVVAALCLADEPNISNDLAEKIVRSLCSQVDESDGSYFDTGIDIATEELAKTRWSYDLADELLDEFFQSHPDRRKSYGSLYIKASRNSLDGEDSEYLSWSSMAKTLQNCSEREAVKIALNSADAAILSEVQTVPGLVEGLLKWLSQGMATGHAMAWALNWMNTNFDQEEVWNPNLDQLNYLISLAEDKACDSGILSELSEIFGTEKAIKAVDLLLMHLPHESDKVRVSIASALGRIGDIRAADALVKILLDDTEEHSLRRTTALALGSIGEPKSITALLACWQDAGEDKLVKQATAYALGKIGEVQCLRALMDCLEDADEFVRCTALGGLAQTCSEKEDKRLLFQDFIWGEGLDPQSPITPERIAEAAQ